MNSRTTILFATVLCCFALCVTAQGVAQEHQQVQEQQQQQQEQLLSLEPLSQGDGTHVRNKRTLFLKKKLLGAGLLGFGLGIAKGYKAGYYSAPEVHHVYVAPPPPAVKYVEYVEKPVFIQKVVEKPVFKPAHVEYEPSWSQPDPSPVYGSW